MKFQLFLAGVVFFSMGCVGGNSNGDSDTSSEADLISSPSAASAPIPGVTFATYLGGIDYDLGRGVQTDSQGNIYITGGTYSQNFPTTSNAYDRTQNGDMDVFISKFAPDGTLLASTLLGGPNYDRAYAVDIDKNGYVYVAGRAGAGFPTSSNILQKNFGGDVNPNSYGPTDGFLAKFNSNLTQLIYCTYLGGDDGSYVRAMALFKDSQGNKIGKVALGLMNLTRPCPFIKNASQNSLGGGIDSALLVLTARTNISFCTYLGGSGDEAMTGIDTDASGNSYLVGHTDSADFPTSSDALMPDHQGGQDIYLAKYGESGQKIYATYLGGSGNENGETHNLRVWNGYPIIASGTNSTNLPVTPNAFAKKINGGAISIDPNTGLPYPDGIVAVFAQDLHSLIYLSYFGGKNVEQFQGTTVDSLGYITVSGTTHSVDMPVTADAMQNSKGTGTDALVVQFDPFASSSNSSLIFASYKGGNADDLGRGIAAGPGGSVYLIGQSYSTSGFAIPPCYDPSENGDSDAYLVKIK